MQSDGHINRELRDLTERVERLEAAKPEQPNYRRYGELKRQLESEFAGLPPADYERAIAIIARATGV